MILVESDLNEKIGWKIVLCDCLFIENLVKEIR